MTEIITTAQMRAIEAAAIESASVTGQVLMERAGAGVVAAVLDRWPELAAGAGPRAVVLCGPGNNGGDGFVIARLLQGRGWAVDVCLMGHPDKLPPDARANYLRWCRLGAVSAPEDATGIRNADVCVDALFGIGLSRPAAVAALFAGVTPQTTPRPRIVAVDVPSGLCADSGRLLGGTGLWADLTVTFHRAKPGHFLAQGPQVCGTTVVCDIGLASEPQGSPGYFRLMQADAARLCCGKSPRDHKYSHGHALIVSGPAGQCGAARLAARGALRVGAGVVTLACPPDAVSENAGRLDAVMVRAVADAAGLTAMLADARINALCLGPAMGPGARQSALLAAALRSGRRLVLDADALTLIARSPALFGALHQGCVLTPHAGEFARLFPDIAANLNAPAMTGPAFSKADAVKTAAQRAGCVVLLKGPDTVIADASGACCLSAAQYGDAAPWLATAGAGDVLAGIITGLLARGADPLQAAGTGAWLHAECARAFGPGLIAEDLPEQLPAVFRGLGV